MFFRMYVYFTSLICQVDSSVCLLIYKKSPVMAQASVEITKLLINLMVSLPTVLLSCEKFC